MRPDLIAIRTGLALAALAAFAVHAGAQSLDGYLPEGVPGYDLQPGVTVRTRLRPGYEPAGIRAGGFVVRPEIAEAVGYDSNVLGRRGSPGSWGLATTAALGVASDWGRDRLGGLVRVLDTRLLDTPRQDRTDATVAAGGARSIGRGELAVAYAHQALHQTATEIGSVASETPVAFRLDDARVALATPFGRVTLTTDAAFDAYRFDAATQAGRSVSQRYRDRDTLGGGVTLRYALAEQRGLLLVARATRSDYVATPAGQAGPDSTGGLLLAGLDYLDGALFRYQLLVGVETRAFDAPRFKTHGAAVVRAGVVWTPTGLTTLAATLSRSIEDPSAEGSAGYTYSRARLVVDHEYLRNVLLQARAGVQVAEYLQGGTQTSAALGAGVTWLLDRRLRIAFDVDVSDRGGAGTPGGSGGYAREIALLTVHFGL